MQYALALLLSPAERTHLENAHYYAQLMSASTYMVIMQAYGIRSAYVFALMTLTMMAGVVGRALFLGPRGTLLGGYIPSLAIFVALGVEAVTTVGQN